MGRAFLQQELVLGELPVPEFPPQVNSGGKAWVATA